VVDARRVVIEGSSAFCPFRPVIGVPVCDSYDTSGVTRN
jgi:hypothetical protein